MSDEHQELAAILEYDGGLTGEKAPDGSIYQC